MHTCSKNFWHFDDFDTCHKQRYLELYPLLGVLVVAIGYTAIAWLAAVVRRRRRRALSTMENEDEELKSTVPNADVVVRGRSVSDQCGIAFQFVLNLIQALIVGHLALGGGRHGLSHLYRRYAPQFPAVWLALVVYTAILSAYRLATRRARAPLVASPFMQQAYIHTALCVVYFCEFYSQRMHPAHKSQLPSLITVLLLLNVAVWVSLFACSVGDAPALLYTANGTTPSPEPVSSLLRIMTCQWCVEMIRGAQRKPMELDDVMDLTLDDHVFRFIARSRRFPARWSFFVRTTVTLWRPIVLNIFFGCSASFLKLTPTIFIQRILQFLESKNVPKGVAWLYVVCLGVAYILCDIAGNQAFYQGRKLSIGVRALIMGSVYEKAIFHRAAQTSNTASSASTENDEEAEAGDADADAGNGNGKPDGSTHAEDDESDPDTSGEFDSSNTGAVINLMSVDAFKIADFAAYLHDFFATPLIVLLSIVFLYRVIGWSAFVAVVAMLLCLPLNVFLASRLNSVQERLMAVTDRRIEKTNEILEAIRIIKLYAWEQRFTEKVLKIRDEELRLLLLRYIYWTSNCFVFFGMPVVVVISSFWCFVRYQHGTLTTSVAFTALAVFSIMRMPLNELAYIFTQLSSAIVSFKRIQAYLNSASTTKYDQIEDLEENGEPVIGFENATFSWASGDLNNDNNDAAAAAATTTTAATATAAATTTTTTTGDNNNSTDDFKLRDISLKFTPNDLNVIVGQTGSGKTSLLLALLGEMQKEQGRVFLPKGNRRLAAVDPSTQLANTVAYCPQEAWLMNGTIKQNILFAHRYDRQRYEEVVRACELTRDLEILERGDQTLIGDKGIALSGGQKQRVSLARAMYSNSRHLILDDCLSAVDSHTAEAIYNNALCGHIAQNRTIVLVSHNIALTIAKAATCTVVANGRIVAHGTPAEVASSGHLGNDELVSRNAQSAVASRVASFANLQALKQSRENAGSNPAPAGSSDDGEQPVPVSKVAHVSVAPAGAGPAGMTTLVAEEDVEEAAVEDESRASGHVPLSTYRRFIDELTDWRGLVLTVGLVALVAVFEYLQNWWVRLWASNSMPTTTTASAAMSFAAWPREGGMLSAVWSGAAAAILRPQAHVSAAGAGAGAASAAGAAELAVLEAPSEEVMANLRYYSIGYAIIGFLSIVVAVAREMIVYYGGVRAARSMFHKLLFTVVNARTRFFDSTPNGRIVNRFTKDIEIIDQEISPNLLWFMISVVDMLQVTIVVSYVTPMLVPLAVVIVYLFMLIGRAYLAAARELKRLESVTRSPIFQQFGETLSGNILIRAYGDTDRFIADNYNAIDTTHRPYFWLWVSNRWLSFCCGMLSVAVCVGGAALIVAGSNHIDAGMAGISLSFSTYFGDCVLWVVRMYAECEVSMNSVERVQEYMSIEQEAAAVVPECRPPTSWPQHGAIDFDGLSLRYSPDLPMVINNVTCQIPGGKKVGVVGRTGAGKSTIITALFRLLEPAAGSVKIDGIDITHLGLHDLRRGLSIIPQEPTLFKGTIRSNLDLFGEHSDAEIFRALCEANLLPANTTPESASETIQAHAVATEGSENLNPFYDLEHEVAEGGRNLSQGQRQLLCLARAILKRPKILLLDEATASIDYETDGIIQATIRNTFKDSTILTIAHRLRTIADYDLILVLEKGEIAQFGHPHDLLQDQAGLFYGMCAKSGELETLEKLAAGAKLSA